VEKTADAVRGGKDRVGGRGRRAQEGRDTRHVTRCERVILSVHVELTLLGSSSYKEILPHVVHLDSTFYLSPVLHMPACLTYEVILRTSEWAFENLGWLSPPQCGKNFPRPSPHLQFRDRSIEALQTISTKMRHLCSKAYILKGETSCFDW
jgi:hypothetical protein